MTLKGKMKAARNFQKVKTTRKLQKLDKRWKIVTVSFGNPKLMKVPDHETKGNGVCCGAFSERGYYLLVSIWETVFSPSQMSVFLSICYTLTSHAELGRPRVLPITARWIGGNLLGQPADVPDFSKDTLNAESIPAPPWTNHILQRYFYRILIFM